MTDKERLEKVKKTFGDRFIHLDIKWLIEQAERVDQLIEAHNLKDLEHQGLVRQLKEKDKVINNYKQALMFYIDKDRLGLEVRNDN